MSENLIYVGTTRFILYTNIIVIFSSILCVCVSGRVWDLFIMYLLFYVIDLPITCMRVYLCNNFFILYSLDRWKDGLQLYILFNSISVIPWEGDIVKLFANETLFRSLLELYSHILRDYYEIFVDNPSWLLNNSHLPLTVTFRNSQKAVLLSIVTTSIQQQSSS